MARDLKNNPEYREVTRKSGKRGYVRIGSKADYKHLGLNAAQLGGASGVGFSGASDADLQAANTAITQGVPTAALGDTNASGQTYLDNPGSYSQTPSVSSIISSQQGQNTLKVLKEKNNKATFPNEDDTLTEEEKLAQDNAQRIQMGLDPKVVPTPEEKPDIKESSVTFVNPQTEASETISGDRATVDAAIANPPEGMEVAETNLNGAAPMTPEKKREREIEAGFTEEVKEITKKFERFMVSEKELKKEVLAISAQWESRIDTVKDINKRNTASLSAQLNRAGGRFVVGTTQGIISESERQGVLAIGELEAQKQAAEIKAKQAVREYNYGVFVDLMDEIDDLKDAKVEELSLLREAQQARDAELEEEKRQLGIDDVITNLIDQGITDESQLFDYANRNDSGELIGDISLEDISKRMKILQPDDALAGLTADFKTYDYLRRINDPSVEGLSYIDYQKAVANAKRAPSTAGIRPSTEKEREVEAIAGFQEVMRPGNNLPDGTPIYGPDGYIGPDGWKFLIDGAPEEGLSREQFIDAFGYQINPAQAENPDWEQYGLTGVEMERITGIKPE